MAHATTTPPSIRIYDSGSSLHKYAMPRRSSSSSSSYALPSAIPMAIPNARESPPPPLPPPRYITPLNDGHDQAWQWAHDGGTNGPHVRQSFPPVKPGSSLLGASSTRQLPQRAKSNGLADLQDAPTRNRSMYSPSGSPTAEITVEQADEDHSGRTRPSLVDHRLQSERQLGRQSLQSSSEAYDKRLLSKIGGPNTPTRTQAPGFLSTGMPDTTINTSASASSSSTSTTSTATSSSAPINYVPTSFHKSKTQLKPLTMPERLYTSLDSPASRWATSGTVSPGHGGFRSPIFDSASSDSVSSRMFGNASATEESVSATRSQRGSYDQGIFMDQDFAMDENGIRDLNINDRSPGSEEYQLKGGLKRRASSPPVEATRDDRPAGYGNNDLYHRRSQQMLVNRSSPVSRFHTNQSSLSSTSSLTPKTGSYASSYGLSVASTATSYSDRLSPSALSPSTETELGSISPYTTANRSSVQASPRVSLARPLQRGQPESDSLHNRKMSSDSLIHSRHSSVSKMSGLFICECCPKKPKKFESEEELRNHELEKQYTCAFCPNRFKNKNEAERHQNSLHLRRHSWSCAALEGPHSAFHPSTTHPGVADVCGYCGKEFTNPANWDDRNDHLNHTHKFGECNQAKKFFRADHFRQHLKHSHAGSSGKWTNMLENACMKDEPLPQRTGGSQSGHSSAIINEVHDET